MRRRRTQTNEVGRCAVLLPALAELPEPLALLEVGASAGLNLLPDRYSYEYLHPDGAVHRVAGRAADPLARPLLAALRRLRSRAAARDGADRGVARRAGPGSGRRLR
jgi:hypothetical protein